MLEEQTITSATGSNVRMPTDPVGSRTPMKQKLPAVLGTKEMTVFLLLIVLFISNVNGVQFGGPATLALWALSTAFLCLFVLGLVFRRIRKTRTGRIRRIFLLAIALTGAVSSGIGIWATFTSSWLPSLLDNNRWTVLVVGSVVLSIIIGWISPRVYREPVAVEAARAELQRCSGSQFDPRVVEAFLGVLDELPATGIVEVCSTVASSKPVPARKEEVVYGI